MVARIITGKSIRGVLNYNEKKIARAEATLLLAAGYLRGTERLSFKNKLERFEMLTSQNERTKTNAVHISLNFSKDDKVDADELKQIAIDYMRRIGFGEQPYLVYQHFDAPHPHIHIATVNIANGGNRIETHNIGRNQSEKARKDIEIEYGLIRAEDHSREAAYIPEAVYLDKVIYGKVATKAAISSVVREVTESYKFTSLPELNAVLRQFNVMADRGSESSNMYANGGLVYTLLDGDGRKVGVPIKASAIFGSPTLKNLEKKYTPNETARKPYGQRLKYLLDKALANSRDQSELEARLQQQGIRILLRENVRGEVYGVTFIDNATRVVFNGSDLGKAYGAKMFMERMAADIRTGIIHSSPPDAGQKQRYGKAGNEYPAQGQPVIQRLIDIAVSARDEQNLPDPFRRKKKKRLLPD